MNKLFRPKCLRRVLLCLAFLFPIVYLCGGLFFGLAGAHGEQIYAEPTYTEEYIQVDSIGEENPSLYRITINDGFDFKTYAYTYLNRTEGSIYIDINYQNSTYKRFWLNQYYLIILPFTDNTTNSINLVQNDVVSYIPWVFYPNDKTTLNFLCSFQNAFIEKLISIPMENVPQNNSAYTDFIFSQPFAKNNFITTLGKDLVNGSTKGFAPMNELFRFINSNMLHFESTDGLAMFGLGYVYYAVNVLIIYVILILAVKLIMLPLKAVDVFDKEDM